MISRTTVLLTIALIATYAATAKAITLPGETTPSKIDLIAVETAEELPEAIAARVKADLAGDLNVEISQLQIGRYSRETWSDGCLGLGGPAESCLAALTEGWQVEIINTATEQSYIYRSDRSGNQIRRAEAEDSISSFSDVSPDYWASEYIQKLAASGIISGFPDGTFRPEAPVTRAQFAAILRQAFPPSQADSAQPFRDVPADYWAAEAIQAARMANFLSGYPGNLFYPQQTIPRVQAIVSLASGLDYAIADTGVLSYYTDAQAIPDYAIAQVSGATEAGVVVSYPIPTRLNPNQSASRADIAALIYQALVQQGQAAPLASPPYAVNPTASDWQTEPSLVIESQGNRDISLSASGLRLLTVKPDILQVWSTQSGERLSEMVTDGSTRFVSAAINGSGTQIAAIVEDVRTQALQLQLWMVDTGEQGWNQPLGTPIYLPSEFGAPPSELVAFSGGSDTLLTQVPLVVRDSAIEASVQLHDSETGQVTQTLSPAVLTAVSFSPDGSLLAGVTDRLGRKVIDVWQLDTGLLRSINPIEENTFSLVDLAFTAEKDLVVLSQENAGYDIHLDSWDVRSGDRRSRIDSLPGIDRQDRLGRLSPDGASYFVRSDVAGTRLIDLNQRTVTSFNVLADQVAFDGVGNRLAIANQQTILIFESTR